MKEGFRTVFGLDLRALALLRMGLAALVLFDLLQRFPDVAFFLSDEGALSRTTLLDTYNRPWALTLYMIAETPFQVRLIMMAHAVFAIGLLAGYRTRLCAIVSWILLVSLQNRNPLVLNGGDTVLAMLSFWILFLPVNARASVDAILSRNTPEGAPASSWDNRYIDVPGVALIFQIVLIYWMTVLFKSDTVWWTGRAVGITLESDQFVKPLGILLRDFPILHAPLTWATVLWELIGPALLFIPWRNHWFRAAAIAGFVTFHAGLMATMELGLFPVACMLAWLSLLPSPFFNWFSRKAPGWAHAQRASLRRAVLRTELPAGTLIQGHGWLGRVLVVAALGYILAYNLRSYDRDRFEFLMPNEARSVGHALKIRQKWSMFSPAPPRIDGWFVLRARLNNGSEIDLINGDQPLSWEKPAVPVYQFPNRRWGKFFNHIRTARYRDLRQPTCDYLIGLRNQRVDVGYQVAEAELYYMLEKTLDDGVAPPEPKRLWYRRNIEPTLW